jgi:hypothetical protein
MDTRDLARAFAPLLATFCQSPLRPKPAPAPRPGDSDEAEEEDVPPTKRERRAIAIAGMKSAAEELNSFERCVA